MLFCRHTAVIVFGGIRHRLSQRGNATLFEMENRAFGELRGTYGEHLGCGVENERADASMAATRSRTRSWFWMGRDARDSFAGRSRDHFAASGTNQKLDDSQSLAVCFGAFAGRQSEAWVTGRVDPLFRVASLVPSQAWRAPQRRPCRSTRRSTETPHHPLLSTFKLRTKLQARYLSAHHHQQAHLTRSHPVQLTKHSLLKFDQYLLACFRPHLQTRTCHRRHTTRDLPNTAQNNQTSELRLPQ